ncbi:hypothetical protein SDC9_147423 [bioreactor metagenome]|uniref:Uncharacterized protein n=1 Tax=bioreactor metagenome TaxID=1076179 RepID=A0A645EGF7_9ZZZZ
MAFTHAAARILLVPNPLPFGTPVTSVSIQMPPPSRFNITSRLPPWAGITPQASKAAFWRTKESNGSPTDWRAEISVNSPWTSISADSKTIFFSSNRLSRTDTGLSPFSNIAAFSTVPPFSLQYGGVSDQPPPQLTRRGSFTSNSSTAIRASLFSWRPASVDWSITCDKQENALATSLSSLSADPT